MTFAIIIRKTIDQKHAMRQMEQMELHDKQRERETGTLRLQSDGNGGNLSRCTACFL
jgi:hypothetical protein